MHCSHGRGRPRGRPTAPRRSAGPADDGSSSRVRSADDDAGRPQGRGHGLRGGATAWATGRKTYNGAISVDTDGNPLPTLGAQAKAAGKATGLVTTAQVTDASPAAFFANTADRGKQDEIARRYLADSKPDVILGGGEDWWLPAGTEGAFPDKPAEDTSEGSRDTKGNLIDKAKRSGYEPLHGPARQHLRARRRVADPGPAPLTCRTVRHAV
ncbi:alkaline phosphatase [Streptomyces sp. NPDC003710]